MDTLGTHLLVELFGCDPQSLQDAHVIEEILLESATRANASVVAIRSCELSPKGFDSVALLKESHFALRTHPESGYVTADLYTCGTCDPYASLTVIQERLGAREIEVVHVERGMPGTHSSRVHGYRPTARIYVDCTEANLPHTVLASRSQGRGLGLFAQCDFRKGEVIYEAPVYLANADTQFILQTEQHESVLMAHEVGMELSIEELGRFPDKLLQALAAYYGLQDPSLTVLREKMTNKRECEVLVTGFDGLVNHAANANTTSALLPEVLSFVDELPEMRMSLSATRSIKAGDELFWDYRSIPGFRTPSDWKP